MRMTDENDGNREFHEESENEQKISAITYKRITC